MDETVHCILGGEDEDAGHHSLTTSSYGVCEQSGDFMTPASGESKFQVPTAIISEWHWV